MNITYYILKFINIIYIYFFNFNTSFLVVMAQTVKEKVTPSVKNAALRTNVGSLTNPQEYETTQDSEAVNKANNR